MPPRVKLVRDLGARLREGHPWVYAQALERKGTLTPGAVVDLVDRAGHFVARGWADPAGPIGLRVLTLDPATPVDEALVRARVASACAIRRAAAALIDSDAARLLHGEGDFVPGLVFDRYAGTGVVRFDGAAAAAFWRPFVPAIRDAAGAAGFPIDRIWARGLGRRGGEGEPLAGVRPDPVEIREGQARYEVDVVHGQKTGFFLDQRENRRVVARHAGGATVLNLFGYTGGFSVASALAGARRVTTVDLARPAIEGAARNFALNGVDPDAHELVTGDAFEFLRGAAAEGRRWDVVVCDPPSFAPSAAALPKARSAYRELNRAAAFVVAAGGLLATASCSSHVTPADFQALVAEGVAAAGRDAVLLDVRGAGIDHPVIPAFAEGRYLKFLLAAIR